MKLFEDKFMSYVVIFALIGAVLVSTNTVAIPGLQSSFEFGGNNAKVYLKGVKFGNNVYLGKSDVEKNGGIVSRWSDDEISIDIDGSPRVISQPTLYPPVYQTDNFAGLYPNIKFKILNNPTLVDYDGNVMSTGYTDKQVNSRGQTVYIYRYAFDLSMSCDADIIKSADIDGLVQYSGVYNIFYDGNKIAVRDISEFGVIDNVYVILTLDLPRVDGWSFAWEGDVNVYPIKFVSSVSGEEFTALNVYQHIEDEYPEILHPTFEDYCFHYNINNNIQLSHSNNGRLMLNIIDGTNVTYIGADSISVPGAYQAWYAGIAYTNLQYKWDNYNPTIKYKITLEITATDLSSNDDNIDDNNTSSTSTTSNYWYTTGDTSTTTGGGGFNPLIGFDWNNYFDNIISKVIIGGVVFIGIVSVAFIIRRKRAPEVYY